MFEAIGALGVAVVVLACPLMMVGMMLMMMSPFAHGRMGGHGSHTMSHGDSHGGHHDEEQATAE